MKDNTIEVMLNAFYYIPMNFVGWFAWKKHMNADNGEVKKQRLPFKKGAIIYAITAVAIVAKKIGILKDI